MRRCLLALVLIASATVAGCGGAENAGSSVASEVAGMIPASAPLVIAFETDPQSEQWRQADELLSKFPGKEKAIAELKSSAKDEGFDLEQDLIPALGDETYLVFLDFEDDGDNIVGLTKPRDKAKLKTLLEEDDEPAVTRELDGWTVIASDAATIDRFAAGGDKLEDADWFQDAQGRVEDDALVTLFANGAPIMEALSQESGIEGCEAPKQQGTLRYAAASLLAEGDGVRFKLASQTEGAPKVSTKESLLSEVPAGAFAYIGSPGLDFGGLGYTDQIRCALESEGVGDIEDQLGVRFEQILDLFAGGFGIYTRPASLIPEVTLLLAPDDAAEGVRTLDTLAQQAAGLLGAAPKPRTFGAIAAKELQLGPVSILYGENDGHIAITTARAGIEALAEGGDSLEDDAAFKSASEAADVGDADVYAYFDLRRLIDLADDVAGFAEEDIPADVRANLEPLRSFVAFGDVSNPDEVEVGAFLEIR